MALPALSQSEDPGKNEVSVHAFGSIVKSSADNGIENKANSQTCAAFVYGGGADFNLTHHVFMRAEYRGFLYNSPTYNLSSLEGTDRIIHRAEPLIGFGYRF